MPVTRSSSILSAQSSSQTRKRTPKPSSEVILLSDDDTLPKRRPSAPNLRRGRSKAQAKPAIVLSDVLEISSDEDNLPVSKRSPLKSTEPSHIVRNLRNQITALERTNAKLQQDYRSLKAKSQAASTALDDHISCDICALHLWSPYILPECGHTFCSSCLEEWFEKTLTQHLRNHPFDNVDANAIGPPPLPNQRAYADALLTRIYTNTVGPRYQQQQPQSRARYSCPSCRTEVRSRPAEEFTLKALVRTIAAEAGESSPKRAAGCASRETGHNSPWDKFFGKATRIPPIP